MLLQREAFDTLLEAKVLIERRRQHYNMIRPHNALGYRPPAPKAWQPRAFAWRTPQQTTGLVLEVTFSPFIDSAGMLGFLLLTSPERVDFLDGKEAFQ